MARKMVLQKDGFPKGDECRACHKAFQIGDEVVLCMLGPGDDKEERTKRDAGRPYAAVAIVIHWDCASLEVRNDNEE